MFLNIKILLVSIQNIIQNIAVSLLDRNTKSSNTHGLRSALNRNLLPKMVG